MVRQLRHPPARRPLFRVRFGGPGVQHQQPRGHQTLHGGQRRPGPTSLQGGLRHRRAAQGQVDMVQQGPGGGPYRRGRRRRARPGRDQVRHALGPDGPRRQAARGGHVPPCGHEERCLVLGPFRASQGQDDPGGESQRHRRRLREGCAADSPQGTEDRCGDGPRRQSGDEVGGTRHQDP